MIQFLRIWKLPATAVKCKHCKEPIRLVVDDRGKYLPFRADAQPIRDERTERGTFQVFDPSVSFHECAKKFRKYLPLAQGKAIR